VNITTKSGSNKFEGGGSISYTSKSLRSAPKNTYLSDGNALRVQAGRHQQRDEHRRLSGRRDRQGQAVLLRRGRNRPRPTRAGLNLDYATRACRATRRRPTLGSNGWVEGKDVNRRYLGKLDWNITDNHHVEFTTFGDNYFTDNSYSGFDYATLSRTGGHDLHQFVQKPGRVHDRRRRYGERAEVHRQPDQRPDAHGAVWPEHVAAPLVLLSGLQQRRVRRGVRNRGRQGAPQFDS